MALSRDVNVVFSEDADAVYQELRRRSSKKERMLFAAIEKKIKRIKKDPFCGQSLSKLLIPPEYVSSYGVHNLFRMELPLFWRLLYSVGDDEMHVCIVALVVDILDHGSYGKKLRYKRK